MDGVYHLIASRFQAEHRISQEVSSSSLDSTLKDTATDQRISSPLPSKSILGVDSDTQLFTTPWCGEQLEFWPLPADEAP